MKKANTLQFLFSPVKINKLELKNRAVMPPMGTGYGNTDSTVSDRLVSYLGRRAQGGTGLIITEVCAIDPRGKGFTAEIGAWSDQFIDGLGKIPQAVHRWGGKVAMQIHHAGRESFAAVAGGLPEAPSAIPSAILGQPCEEMSIERINQVIEAFASAAYRAREAGFDAVEAHGAHGYLIGQFLSPFSNNRTDLYGGSDENRARFAIETIQAIRKRVGQDFPVIIRVSADELIKGGYDISFMKWLAPKLVSAGADAIHASVGVFSTPGNLTIASMDTEPEFNLHRARAIKEVVDVPVIGVGRINDPRIADEAIARGDADLISFGRQHLTDPDFINKAMSGNFEDIRFCLACNQGCIERLSYEFKSATCTINPDCGKEYKGTPAKSESPKNIWVIGAGPAGLAAALAASERGHRVTVYEKDDEPGGQLRSASKPPHKQAFAEWMAWALRQLRLRDVGFRFSTEVTEQILALEKPDAIILASGAYSITPEIPGINGPNVCDARDLLLGRVDLKDSAIILGAGYVGMETADYLISRNVKVFLLEMKPAPPVGRRLAHGYWLHKRLKEAGAEIILGAKVKSIAPKSVVYQQENLERRIEPAPLVVKALGAASDTLLSDILARLKIPFKVAGDAGQPRRLLEAVHEGTEAGRFF